MSLHLAFLQIYHYGFESLFCQQTNRGVQVLNLIERDEAIVESTEKILPL
ncbi:hypothetical protein JMN32_04065 [Fulvivirga sp. 29W222]|uniref:Uncharacterized protein n=1 Tax=Fulvivirga marina TaxID=2494733 RepID=A0A937FUY5_9BACT|nr:hypothetical protein [Fulvivirga marina]MBL6445468.1 hypothetical protein [Fulvivirga marina]